MDKWSCLRVIIDFVEQQRLKPGHVSFVQMPFDVAKQSVLGCALPSFAGVVTCSCLCDISSGTALASLLRAYTGRCHSVRETIQHHALKICFLAYTSLFSIKSNVLKLRKSTL